MMEPVYKDHGITLFHGEAEEVMRQLASSGYRFNALITDSPYCSGGATARERTGKGAKRNLSTMIDAVQIAGWRYSDLLPWDKTEGGCRPCKGWFRNSQAEYVVMGLLGSLGREQERAGECLPGVLRGNRTTEEKTFHMHAKPVEVMRTLLKPLTWMHGGKGMGLDPFAGSGSTLVAARQLGLQFIGIEREEANVEITLKRLREVML